jgi:hypothetical protein
VVQVAKIALAALSVLTVASPLASAAPATGDVYVYRISNGYNNELRGHISYRVEAVEAGRVTVAVTPDHPSLGPARSETYAADGNWLRHPVTNHDRPVDYEFSPAFPAYDFPLDAGKSWSARVNAIEPATGRRASVRVDGAVVGSERISAPAGTFDTIKLKRYVYAGDWDGFLQPTTITEIEWYAPALGRAVKSESKSDYINLGSSRSKGGQWTRGEWLVMELAEFNVAKP